MTSPPSRRLALAGTASLVVPPVCLAAEDFWQAMRAADALDLAMEPGAQGDLSTERIDALVPSR